MEKLLTNDATQLFMLAVFPGLISMHIYRLCLPARAIEWKTAILEGMFYSAVNSTLCLPIIYHIYKPAFQANHPVWFFVGVLFVLLVGPIMWPFVLTKVLKSRLMKKLQLPYPTSWDYFFDQREPAYVLVHLSNGELIGGFYGEDSYAASFPNQGDLYLETVIKVDESGKFISVIEGSKGMLVEKQNYEYLEFFGLPQDQEKNDE